MRPSGTPQPVAFSAGRPAPLEGVQSGHPACTGLGGRRPRLEVAL